MIKLDYEQFVEEYKPIKNKYFPESPLGGYLFFPSSLGQIAGFMTERKLWTLCRKTEVIVKDSGEKKDSYYITTSSALNTPSDNEVIGYLITEFKWEQVVTMVRDVPYS